MKALLAGLAIALIVGHLLRESPGYMARDADGAWHGDLEHYVYWTRLVTLGGVQAAYSGTWPETYAVYPPVTLYPLWVIGNAYRWTQDPSFEPNDAQQSLWLHEAIKGVALGWHILAALGVYFVVRRRFGATAAGLVAYIVPRPGHKWRSGHALATRESASRHRSPLVRSGEPG